MMSTLTACITAAILLTIIFCMILGLAKVIILIALFIWGLRNDRKRISESGK